MTQSRMIQEVGEEGKERGEPETEEERGGRRIQEEGDYEEVEGERETQEEVGTAEG